MIIEYIPVDSIKLDVNQPRKIFEEDALEQLKNSIAQKGIEMPLIVRESEEQDSIYVLLDGERRLRSARALNFREVPCIIDNIIPSHPKLAEIDVTSKQLRLDFLKNKLTGEELDKAIYDLWISLELLPEDALELLGVKQSSRDWRIPFISKEIGVGYTQITMSLNKEDFKNRNKEFHEKMVDKFNSDFAMSKRYNRILGETSRHEGLRDDDNKRKTVIQEYLDKAISGDGKELRDKLKKISETKNLSEEQIKEIFGLPADKKNSIEITSKPEIEQSINDTSELNEFAKKIISDMNRCHMNLLNVRHAIKYFDPKLISQLKIAANNILEVLKESEVK